MAPTTSPQWRAFERLQIDSLWVGGRVAPRAIRRLRRWSPWFKTVGRAPTGSGSAPRCLLLPLYEPAIVETGLPTSTTDNGRSDHPRSRSRRRVSPRSSTLVMCRSASEVGEPTRRSTCSASSGRPRRSTTTVPCIRSTRCECTPPRASRMDRRSSSAVGDRQRCGGRENGATAGCLTSTRRGATRLGRGDRADRRRGRANARQIRVVRLCLRQRRSGRRAQLGRPQLPHWAACTARISVAGSTSWLRSARRWKLRTCSPSSSMRGHAIWYSSRLAAKAVTPAASVELLFRTRSCRESACGAGH